MTENNRGLQNTEYLSVTFEEIKQRLLERAETYYPDTYRDFNKSSFGSLMFDLVAMVGEQLNFYAQFVANEGFIEYARTGIGLTTGARRYNVTLGNTAPRGYVTLQFPMVVSEDQVTPDPTGKYSFLKGALATGPGNAVVELQEDVIIDPSVELSSGKITTSFSPDGSRPLVYFVEKQCPAIAGQIQTFVVDVERYSNFLSIEVPDRSCTDILSIIDSEGNNYYQVDSLGINSIEIGLRYTNSDNGQEVEKMIDLPVPRRFSVKEEGEVKFIEFGYGSEDTLKIIEGPAKSSEYFLDKQGHRHPLSKEITPGKRLQNDKYGVAPSNTTLTITYRSNSSDNSNISIGEINTIQSAEIVFDDEVGFGEANMQFIRNNISCTNNEPFNGVVRYQSTKEIALTCQAAAGAQARAVTEKDLVSMCYVMPPQFGKITKASVHRDSEGLRKMLNLYCISEDLDGNLEAASTLMKENLKKWINSVKMMTDRIDIFDAKILNLNLFLDITLKDEADAQSAIPRIREFLYNEINLTRPEIGQHFSIGEIERILTKMPIIQRINRVQVGVKNGTGYSSVRYDIMPNAAPDGSTIYMPEDFIWEIKNPTDITGIIK